MAGQPIVDIAKHSHTPLRTATCLRSIESKRPATNADRVNEKVNQSPVANAKGQEDAKVTPFLTGLNVKRSQVLGTIGIGTVAAHVGSIRVDQVAPAGLDDEVVGKLGAGLARGRPKVGGLAVGAADLLVGEGAREHAADIVRGRVDIVHPVAPKDGELLVGHKDAVEDGEHDQEEGQDVADDGKGRGKGADPLRPAGLEQEEEERHEEDEARGAALGGQAGGKVPEHPVQHGRDDGAGNLGEDGRGAKGDPAVDAGRVLAGLPEGAVHEELGQDGVHGGGQEEEDEKGREHAALHVLDRVAELPKREAVEDANENGDKELAVDVRGLAPLLDKHALGEEHRLLLGRRRAAVALDALNLLGQRLVLVRLEPLLVPELAVGGLGALLNQELGHVLALGALGAAGGKVVDDGAAVFADGAKVKDVAAGVERQDLVKLLNELRRGLVYGADDGLARGAELAQEADNGKGRLGVEPGRGLVEEEQQRRLGGELDANGQPLLLLDAEGEDDGVLDGLHLEQVNNLVDVGNLVLARRVPALAEERGELERLADRGGLFVQIHLLDEAGAALKVGGQGGAVDEHAAFHNADGLALGERVEKRGLAGAGSTHEGHHDARLGVTLHVVEQLLGTIGAGDGVVDIFPSENLFAALKLLQNLVGGGDLALECVIALSFLLARLFIGGLGVLCSGGTGLGLFEDENAHTRGGKGQSLSGQDSDENVQNRKCNQDGPVAPEVGAVVVVVGIEVVGTVDRSGASG
ncbi:hypothetical protein BM221_001128 [Beauveria bassiana]|uniref:Uncharacterized protein n=1 Tax=Beauveria bassiana TaxID=176275 RepID=A0A2N6P2F2_BEABA|nr:hypothetical protein BM221_001128 [Beauveria bassiana]